MEHHHHSRPASRIVSNDSDFVLGKVKISVMEHHHHLRPASRIVSNDNDFVLGNE